MNSFCLKNAYFCFGIGLFNALLFSYLRLNLETPLLLLVNILSILLSTFFFPIFFMSNFFYKNKDIHKYIYPFISIFLMFFIITNFFFSSKIIILYYFLSAYCLFFIFLNCAFKKQISDVKYIAIFLSLLIFISCYYFTTISNSNLTSVFSPEQGFLGILNHDTRFHSAISHNIQNFRQISLGMDGYASIKYHYFYHIFIAAIGEVSNSDPLWTMSAVQYIIFVPSLIFFVNYVAASVNNFKEDFLYYTFFSFCLLFVSENIFTYNYSYFDSVTLPLSLICLLSSIPTLLKFSHLRNNSNKFFLAIFLILFSIIIFANKVSSGSLYLLLIGWIFFRNYKFSTITFILGFFTIAVFYINYSLFSPKLNDFLGYKGQLFNFFYVLKVWGQISVFSPYLFVLIYLFLINFSFKFHSQSKMYFAEALTLVAIVSFCFLFLGIPQDSAVVFFIYVPMIISIPLIVANISYNDFMSLLIDKNKQIRNVKKIITLFISSVLIFIIFDKTINLEKQIPIIKEILLTNDKLSNNKFLNNNIRPSQYIKINLNKNLTLFDKDFYESLKLNYFYQIYNFSKKIEKNKDIAFFIPPNNRIIWDFSNKNISKYSICGIRLHLVPSIIGFTTILGAPPLNFDCPKEAYTNNYYNDYYSRNISYENMCIRAKSISINKIYILNEKNGNLETKLINCLKY